MRSRPSPAFRPQRALAVAGLASLGAGLLMLATAAGATASAGSPAAGTSRAASQYPLAAHPPTRGKPSRAADREFAAQVKQQMALTHADAVTHSPITVTGPHMWDPSLNGGKGGQNPKASTVSVSQTASLIDQQISVSWTNFTPSNSLAYTTSTDYAVMVAQCKGTNPSSPADCYAAETGGVTSNSGSVAPPNTSYATTGPDGTGATDIHLLVTKAENTFLGCDQRHPCSLLIEPAQGGNSSFTPPHCKDHSQDAGFGGFGTAEAARVFTDVPNQYFCSWAKRIVVPLTFARTAATCSFKNSAFSVEGSPMMARAVDSWNAALCVGSHGLTINYNSQVAEPQAITDTGSGIADVALTTRSASSQQISTGTKHHFIYAPVGVSAVSVAYWFDNAATGQPVTNIRLNQRLLLKLFTQSYAFGNDGCPPGLPGTPCDNGVDHNPISPFGSPPAQPGDAEFLQLNPDYASQNGQPPLVTPPGSSSIILPIVQQGLSDMTWTVTNWIAANTDAKQFLTGQFDPGGVHLNTWYNGLQYPTNEFVGQDNFPLTQLGYTPVFPLSRVTADMVENWPPGQDSSSPNLQGPGFQRFKSQPPGTRSLVAILDQGDAAAFLFPAAKLPNGAGRYVAPTTAHMTAALQNMTSDGGTKLVNPNSKNKDAYPLTMVIYAMVPTSGTSHAKAAAIARFLDFAAGAGQKPGVQPGQLPPGYAPLPASMQAQTRKDAFAVLHQTGASAPKNKNPGKNNSGSSSTSKSGNGSGSASPPGATTPSPGATGNPISLVNVANVHPASITRYILPALLILGGLAALAGSSSLVGSSSTPISARLRRIGQAPVAWSRAARTRLGLRRSK
jgi:hypothetical protein